MNSIYYCTSGPAVAGGQHVNAEHVAALRGAGLRAYLLYIPTGNKAEQFQSIAPVLQITPEQKFEENDVVVIPEGWPKILKYFSSKKVRKIIHCQNPHYLFHSFDSIQALQMHGFQEIISCSRFTEQMMRQFGFTGTIYTVHPAISDVFFRDENVRKKLQIAYMPRKRAIESQFISGLFRSQHPTLKSIEWVRIENKTRQECARILKDSAIFASFGFLEGLGLPPLEAMASDCIVVGFHGLGGTEYATAKNGFWVQEGNYFDFVRQVFLALQAAQDPAWKASILLEGRKTAEIFRRESFEKNLLATWRDLLGNTLGSYLLE